MIIRKITVHNLGPFYDPFEIELDSHVTILTGSNDVGKSSLLKAIELALCNRPMSDDLANQDHGHEASVAPSKDPSISVIADIELTAAVDIQNGKRVSPTKGDMLKHVRNPAREVNTTNHQSRFGSSTDYQLNYPAIIKPGTYGDFLVNSEINLEQPKDLEKALLDAAFGEPFNLPKTSEMQIHRWHRRVRMANDNLNQLLAKVMPESGLIKFDLHPDFGGNRKRLGVQLRDRHDAVTLFGDRGSGVRKMIGLLAELITLHRGAHHKVVLIDEPENSLHADAQHLLREFLFSMTTDGRTQVVYATHSPSMLNPMRGQQVRVLHRTTSKNGKFATTRLLPAPEESNFLAVRTSLGMSAGDSLLYAPVTVVTEGITEVRCLPKIVARLNAAQRLEGLDADRLLGLVTFLDGNGDSVEYLCRLAKAHGAKVILFLDGDKRRMMEQIDMAEKHPDVPIVYVTGTKEFEQLVPERTYLKALAEKSEVDLGEDPSQELAAWTAAVDYRSRVAFSKRVERWFEEDNAADFPPKKEIMARALDLSEPNEIDGAPIQELLERIKEAIAGTSFD